MKKITCQDAVLALKQRGLSTPAKDIAEMLGTDSRAVATALRSATKDGRVTSTHRKGIAFYRFKRLTVRTAA